jgi:hypothetical protein
MAFNKNVIRFGWTELPQSPEAIQQVFLEKENRNEEVGLHFVQISGKLDGADSIFNHLKNWTVTRKQDYGAMLVFELQLFSDSSPMNFTCELVKGDRMQGKVNGELLFECSCDNIKSSLFAVTYYGMKASSHTYPITPTTC